MKGKVLIYTMAVLLLAAVLLPEIKVKAYTQDDTAELMAVTGIIPEINIRHGNKKVTRGEYAGMLVMAADSGTGKARKVVQLFKDVPVNHRQASYIQEAVGSGYMTGYLGGRFKPEQPVTLREAINGLLRILGYKEDDINTARARLVLYRELKLNKGLNISETDPLTGNHCVKLFYNLLKTKTKDGTVYGEKSGCSFDENGEIDLLKMRNKLTEGPLVVKKGWQKKLAAPVEDYRIYRNDKPAVPAEISEYSIVYFSNKLKKIWVYDKKVHGLVQEVKKDKGTIGEITIAGHTYVPEPGNAISDMPIDQGTPLVLLLGRNDAAAAALPVKTGLYRYGETDKLMGKKDSIVYKNGELARMSSLEQNDVLYYSVPLKTIWAYNLREYGTVEKISPNATAPEEIVISGKTYTLKYPPVGIPGKASGNFDQNDWGLQLSSAGIREGSNVIALFGYNGTLAGIIPAEKMSVIMTGYVLSTEETPFRDSRGKVTIKNRIQFADTYGTVRRVTAGYPDIRPGDVIEVSFKDGDTVVNRVFSDNRAADFDKVTGRVFAADIGIIDIKGRSFARVTSGQLEEIPLSASNVLYYSLNARGEVDRLILRDATGILYQYGILKKVKITENYDEDGNIKLSGILTVDIQGEEASYTKDLSNDDLTPGPRGFIIENGTIKEMISLYGAAAAYIDGRQVNTGEGVYDAVDKTPVYLYSNNKYYPVLFPDISDMEAYRIKVYMEHPGHKGGQAKLIVAVKLEGSPRAAYPAGRYDD